MSTCTVFGHGDADYGSCADGIEKSLTQLIEGYGVTQFYIGGRGTFDNACAEILKRLKRNHPHIKITLVLSYIPKSKEKFFLPNCYDDSLYLLEKPVPPRFAILKTNELMVLRSDYILSGVKHAWGGAYTAVQFAKKKGKPVFEIFPL